MALTAREPDRSARDAVLLPMVFLRLTGMSAGAVAAWIAVGAGYWFARAYRARPVPAHLGRELARHSRSGRAVSR